jgi:hypothetical protein
MSTPIDAQEIREALEAHARFDDTAALARLGSVKARVRVVRRRRRATLAGAAAAVVAVAGGVAAYLPGQKDAAPASRTFGDLVAPATMTAGGATYSFDRMVTGTAKVTITDKGDQPALVTWATAGATTATIEQPTSERPYASAADFADFQRLYEPDGTEVTATGAGRIALALYTLDQPAPGARADIDGTPVVLRAAMPGFRAIDAVWGDPGQTDVAFTFTYPERTLETVNFCTGAPGYDLHVDIGGPSSVGACSDEASVDGPGDRTGFTDGIRRPDDSVVQPGDQVTAHLWLSRKGSAKPVRGPIDGVRMGIGLYETEPTVATIGEFPLTELREDGGHTWRFVRVLTGDEVGRAFSTTLTAGDRPVLLRGPRPRQARPRGRPRRARRDGLPGGEADRPARRRPRGAGLRPARPAARARPRAALHRPDRPARRAPRLAAHRLAGARRRGVLPGHRGRAAGRRTPPGAALRRPKVVGVEDELLDAEARDRAADRRRGRADGAALAGPRPVDALDRRHHPGRAGQGDPRALAQGRRVDLRRPRHRQDGRGAAPRGVPPLHRPPPLRGGGVLVVGPSGVFMRYIERVLPSLGETASRCARSARSSTACARPGTTSRRSPTSRARPGWPS